MASLEEDCTRYQELQRSVEKKREEVARLMAELRLQEEELQRFITEVRARVTPELIVRASKEYELHLISLIQEAIEAGDLRKAAAIAGRLERHLESMMGEHKPGQREDHASQAPRAEIGRVEERIARTGERVLEVCRFEYDETGRLVRELYYSPQSRLTRIWQIEYDELGRVRKRLAQDPRGGLLETREVFRNEAGLVLKEVSRDGAGVLQWESSYEYEKGRLARVRWLDREGRLTKLWEYRYGDGPNPIGAIWRDARGKVFGSCDYRHDSAGRLAAEVTRDRQGEPVRTIEYEYR